MRYAKHLLEPSQEARLVAVSRRNVQRGTEFASAQGIRFHQDWQDLIADRHVEAVVVVTPPSLNRSVCLAAVQWRKAMLIEKPLAVTGADARAMVAAATSAGIPLMTAQTVRYEAAAIALKHELASVGRREYMVLSNRVEPNPDLTSNPADYGGRGVLLETGIHLIDLVRYLTEEEVMEVRCEMDRERPAGPERRALASFRTSGNFRCIVDSSRVTGGRVSRAEWVGEKGQVAADWIQHRLWRITSRSHCEEWKVKDCPTVETVLRAFLAALKQGTPMPVTGLDGQRAVEIADACYQSAQEDGRRVTLTYSEPA
jgi:predicted dehydrogenase